MKYTPKTNQALNRFHKELGDVIQSMMDRIDAGNIPDGIEFYEMPVRASNQWVSLGFSVETNEFYLHGKNSDGSYQHIML